MREEDQRSSGEYSKVIHYSSASCINIIEGTYCYVGLL